VKSILPISLFLIGIIAQNVFGKSASQDGNLEVITDGPYIFKNKDKLEVIWVCKGKSESLVIADSDLPYTFSECGLSAHVSSLDVPKQQISYQGKFKVAALSDLHGQYDLMLKLLKNNDIIDSKNNWNFGANHFVITGDIFDRGDKVTEILWFLYILENQAIAAGGNLHLVLGNHEVMVLNNRLKYLHKKYPQIARILEKPFTELFSQNSILGAWIRSKNVLVKVNDSLFAHGGFHPSLVNENINLSMINNIFKEHLVETELEAPRIGMAKFLHKSNGPIWYRGYFNEIRATYAEVNALLSHFDVARIVVGHTSQIKVESRYQNRIIGIDTSIKRGLNGEMLFIDGKALWRGSLSGETLAL
jgi:hypothetical protein